LPDGGGALRRILRGLAIILAVIAIGFGAIAGYWYFGPYRGFAPETFVEIERGMTTRQIARTLAEQGVVRAWWAFATIRVVQPRATLQAGEYRFGSAQTPWQVFQKIRRGEIFYEDFTVPEGSNMFEIASLLERIDMVDPDDFLKEAANPELVRDIDSQAPTLEGYLFPSTYRLNHNTTARQLCAKMISEFRKQWITLGPGLSADTHRIVTLASLVEKETAIPPERTLVAAVFANRLRLNMPLQCDPTTVYAAVRENRYQGVIHRSDLASEDAYNTYTHLGLPPGPIANPGIASLKAALHPAQTDFLYFVAKPDNSGSHQFSAKLLEHEKAVLAYRKGAR